MLRITLGGKGLEGFPDNQDGAYVKLQLDDLESGTDAQVIRTYTVRYYDAVESTLDVDFVLHEEAGPAATWARACEPGDVIRVGGPGPRKFVDQGADWFLFVGDMSALPAISANLEALPARAMGYALLEVIDTEDRQELRAPEGVQISWINNPHPELENSILLNAVRNTDWLSGRPAVWVAGELSQSLAIRTHLKDVHGLTRDVMYASSYWQIGQTEDGHRVAKRAVGEA